MVMIDVNILRGRDNISGWLGERGGIVDGIEAGRCGDILSPAAFYRRSLISRCIGRRMRRCRKLCALPFSSRNFLQQINRDPYMNFNIKSYRRQNLNSAFGSVV